MTSYIILTNNSEDKIEDMLKEVSKKFKREDELIIFDNLSDDGTVPKIIELIGFNFKDTKHFKFYINKEKEPYSVLKKKAFSIAKYRKELVGGYNVKNK